MSEKQSNELDDMFRQAAEQDDPPYNDAAWVKMERLLDEDKRKRPIAWWWWMTDVLMIGAVAFLLLGMPHSNTQKSLAELPVNTKEKSVSEKEKYTNNKTPLNGKTGTEIAVAPNERIADNSSNEKNINTFDKTGKESTEAITTNQEKVAKKGVLEKDIKISDGNTAIASNITYSENKKTNKVAVTIAAAGSKENVGQNKMAVQRRHSIYKTIIKTGNLLEKEATVYGSKRNESGEIIDKGKSKIGASEDVAAIDDKEQNDLTRQDRNTVGNKIIQPDTASIATVAKVIVNDSSKTEKSVAKTKKPKEKKKTTKGLFVFGGAGPEWTWAGNNKLGTTTLAYGGGLGYSFGKRLSVQAGVFFTSKKYGATGKDYHVEKGSYYDIYPIQTVDANCGIIEIPLLLRYTFLTTKHNAFYASIGGSSVIMKKEAYDYSYEKYNQLYSASHTYTTKKFSAFSSLYLSAGYERMLKNNFSLLVEPYAKIPLSGVGEGRIRLGSFGMMVGAKYGFSSMFGKKK